MIVFAGTDHHLHRITESFRVRISRYVWQWKLVLGDHSTPWNRQELIAFQFSANRLTGTRDAIGNRNVGERVTMNVMLARDGSHHAATLR
jgi:hypothetical protein